MTDVPDRIERTIDIDASAERVWTLVSRPGWWINDGELVEHRLDEEGDLVVVHVEEHGEFRIRIGALEPPRRAVFRWTPHSGGGLPDDTAGTEVEFRIEDRPSGVRLVVVETGFASLALPEDRRRRDHADNTEGWTTQLDLARGAAEAA